MDKIDGKIDGDGMELINDGIELIGDGGLSVTVGFGVGWLIGFGDVGLKGWSLVRR